jgi:hypothetical protein
MKQYIATFRILNAAFNSNDIETIWISAANRKEAENRARFLARQDGDKFISIRMVK